MADLIFWLSQGPLNPDHNPLITVDFECFTNEHWYPYHESIVSIPSVSILNTHYPVAANGRELQYVKTISYFDDFYNRIHITPNALDLGNVASEQVSTVMLWNAYLNAKTLQSIDGLPEGITVSGHPTPPLSVTALQERAWNISILVDGPSTIDNYLTWNFGTDQPKIHITGNRVVPFCFLVDWSKTVNESLVWLTDVLQSQTGHEQRRSLRIAPRISFDAEFLLYGSERQFFDLSMIGWGTKTFAMPLWPQQQWLKTAHAVNVYIIYCDTIHRNFRANRLAILRGENCFDNETVEIESVLSDRLILKRPLQKTWPAGSCLTPAATAILASQPNIIKRTDTMMRTNVTFQITETVDNIESMPTTSYRNAPLLLEAPNEKNDLTHSYERLLSKLDNQKGLAAQFDVAQTAFGLYQYAWMTHGRVEQAKLRALFYALRGRQKSIWLPTFSQDLTIQSTVLANNSYLMVAWCGYSRFGLNQLGRQDIQILLSNGTILNRRIVAASEINNKTEKIQVDTPFPTQIELKHIVRVSFLSLCRLSADNVTVEHINDSDGIAKAVVNFRGVRES